jgi:hypothetical protein
VKGICKWCGRQGRFYPEQPEGYVAWDEWAEKKSRTHHQERCPGCGRFSVWKLGAGDGE